jgi:hypothetical protein
MIYGILLGARQPLQNQFVNVLNSPQRVTITRRSIQPNGVSMKLSITSLFLLAVLATVAVGQTSQPSSDRMFFPKDMFWGWAQVDLAPPHNEIDPNLCSANAGQYGGANAPCSMFARYMISGMLEVRPFGQGVLRRFMLFGAPSFLFGKNVPQNLYTWSPDAIGVEHSWGASIFLGHGYELRVTQHFLLDRIGARDTNLGLADLGNNGPWGRYNTIGVRKTWGTKRW